VTGDCLAVFDDNTREGEIGGDVAYLWCTHVWRRYPVNPRISGKDSATNG
jgi:hypothetical protein